MKAEIKRESQDREKGKNMKEKKKVRREGENAI